MRGGTAFALLAVLLGGATALGGEAGPVTIRVRSGSTRATVGDRILVRVEVAHPSGVTVSDPVPVAGEAPTLALEAARAPASERKTEANVSYFQGQAFETGPVQVPAFRVEWKRGAGEIGTAVSEPVPVEIVSVLKGPQERAADLKPPAEIPPPPFPWIWALLALALVALVTGWAVLLARRRKRPAQAAPAPSGPSLPAHEQAYRELEHLLSGPLLREGKVKQFHVEMSDIVKRYLASRFGIETLERTSEEVLEGLGRVRIGSEPLAAVREFFSANDLVKFAKHRPEEDEIRRSVDRAYRIVDLTKVAPAPPAGAEATAPSPAIAGSAR